jgi:hypothetical protein
LFVDRRASPFAGLRSAIILKWRPEENTNAPKPAKLGTPIPPPRSGFVQLWNAEIVVSPEPEPIHQEIVLNFAQALKAFVSRAGLGKVYVVPLDVVLTQRRVVQTGCALHLEGAVGDCEGLHRWRSGLGYGSHFAEELAP